ncbi:unnamed protein product, partial [Iphiclides podalirius]
MKFKIPYPGNESNLYWQLKLKLSLVCPLDGRGGPVVLERVYSEMSVEDRTVRCCGRELSASVSEVKFRLQRNWIKTKKLTARAFDVDSLRRGAGVNVQDDNGYTPLHHACLRGHKEIVRLLLSVDALPCAVDKKGATPLHLAAWKGDSDIVSMLLAHNNPTVNIDQWTSDQETALLIAAQFGYVDVVAQLLARGADAELRNMKDESALDLAAQYGRLETVQHMLRVRPLLVQPYKYPSCRDKIFSSSTPLHRASKNGHKEVVSALLDAGFDPNVRSYSGTPLHEAACFGKASVVRILLAKGADLHAVDNRGRTVDALLGEYSGEAIKRVRRVIREYESVVGNYHESEEELPPFPVQGYSPTGYPNSALMKAPETQKNTNKSESLFPSSSSLTKSTPQSFVKKLASKCLGLKAKFNSAPNISNSSGLESESDVKSKHSDSKNSANTLLIVNKSGLPKIKSVPSNLEEPYAVVNVKQIVKSPESPTYVTMSPYSSMASSYGRYSVKDIAEVISLGGNSTSADTNPTCASDTTHSLLRKSSSSEHSGHWSLQSCNSNVTIKSDASFKTCLEESSEGGSDVGSHSDEDTSDAETVKSDISTAKRPWVHSDSFRFGDFGPDEIATISEEAESKESKCESGISVECSESSSGCEGDSGVPGAGVALECASLERVWGRGGVRSGSGRRRWDEGEGTSEGDALSVSSAASSCAPLHLAHHHDYSKVSPTPPKKPPRRNLSVSPTHANSPSSGYSYELRAHARSQDDLDEIQGAKHHLKHGRSVDQYVDGKLSYAEYEENHNSPRAVPVPNPRPSLKHRSQPVAITAMYENVVIKEQNPRRKLRRNNFAPPYENVELRRGDGRANRGQERSSLESLLDDQSANSPSECDRYYDRHKAHIPLSPTHYEQPPTPDHPPPSAKQAENSIHERIRPLSQLIMEVVEEIRIRKKSQGDVTSS